jgi:plasmid replication initiation protein
MQIAAQSARNSLELKKHVGLIHSTNKLSLLERKIANALLYNAYENLSLQDEHEIHIPSLCDLIGYNSKDYKTIKKSLISLISTVLEWNLVDKEKTEEKGIWIASSMLSDAKIEGSICTYSYSKRMRELCYYPEFYGRLNMSILSKFKSSYGIALYENCVRYQNISQTPWFDFLTYRKLMGIEEGKYELFRDLNKRVIQASVLEVNKYSPISITPEFKKHGRAVVSIRFLIRKQIQNEIQAKEKESLKTLKDQLVLDFGCSETQVNNFIDLYGEKYLQDKIALIESSSSYLNGKIANLSKYLEKALRENYQPQKSSKEHIQIIKRDKENEIKSRQDREDKMNKYRIFQNREFPNVFRNLPTKERLTVEKNFHQFIKPTLYYNLYLKDGIENPLISDRFGDFIREVHPKIASMILSFEEFCEQY